MKNNIFRVLEERAFLYLWVGELFTQISINLFTFFLILEVFKLTHSNTAVSGIVLSITLPQIFFGLLAGVYVDRWSKKNVLLSSNIVRAILLILLALFHENLVMIYLISFLISLTTQFFIPAESPIIPLIVSRKNLLSANALFGMGIFGSILVAYAISGPLILYLGQVKTLIILAVSLLVGALFISFVATPATDEEKVEKNKIRKTSAAVMTEVRDVLKLMRGKREIYNSLFLLALSQILILIIAVVAPGYANQILGIPVEEFPLLFVAPAALGTVVGAVGLVNLFHERAKNRMVEIGLLLSGAAMLVLPYGSKVASKDFVHTLNTYLPHIFDINIFHIIVVVAFILGIANAFVFVPSNTTLQEETDDEFRGKIYGFLNSVVGVSSFLPVIAVGGLSDLIGVGRVITGIGISLLILGVTRFIVSIS